MAPSHGKSGLKNEFFIDSLKIGIKDARQHFNSYYHYIDNDNNNNY